MSNKLEINIDILKRAPSMRFVITFLILVTNIQLLVAQVNKNTITLKFGVYGIYSKPETYERNSIWEKRTIYYSYYSNPWQELKISENGTFTFYEIFGEGNIREFNGKWKIKKDTIIFYGFKNDKSRPIPTMFDIKENQLCSLKKTKLCYEWQENSRK